MGRESREWREMGRERDGTGERWDGREMGRESREWREMGRERDGTGE